ncbi:LOW QUALITY PROTEIN: DNA-(apurinic or apyrimidinic site) endonuclease 2 [Rhynchocyon petersi]
MNKWGTCHLNCGSWLDYVLGNKALVIDIAQHSFLPEVTGSDHCLVAAIYNKNLMSYFQPSSKHLHASPDLELLSLMDVIMTPEEGMAKKAV